MSKQTFAVIEESRSVPETFHRMLESRGEVDTFHSEEEFFRRARPEDFDCILVEARIAQGLHLQLLEKRSATPIIYLAAEATAAEAVAAIKLGAVDYLALPPGDRELDAALEAALRQARTGVPDRYFSAGMGLESKLDNMERELICEALQRASGVVGGRNGAARLLGVTRTGLLYKMRRLNISRAVVDEPESDAGTPGESTSGAIAGA